MIIMLLIIKRAKVLAFVVLFAFITVALLQEALRTALFRGKTTKEDGIRLDTDYGGKVDGAFDEAAENETRTKLALAIKEML